MTGAELTNASVHAAGGYGPPGGGGGWGPPPGGGQGPGGYGGPPPGGYGGPPQGGGYGVPPAGGFGGGGFGGGGGGGFGPPGGGFAPPGGPMGPGMGDDINTTLPLILSIISLACCWGAAGISFILGVIGLVFSIQAGNAKKTGDMETARSKAKTALTLAIIGMVLGIIGSSIYSFLTYGR